MTSLQKYVEELEELVTGAALLIAMFREYWGPSWFEFVSDADLRYPDWIEAEAERIYQRRHPQPMLGQSTQPAGEQAVYPSHAGALITAVIRSGAIAQVIDVAPDARIFVWAANAEEQIEAALQEAGFRIVPTGPS